MYFIQMLIHRCNVQNIAEKKFSHGILNWGTISLMNLMETPSTAEATVVFLNDQFSIFSHTESQKFTVIPLMPIS